MRSHSDTDMLDTTGTAAAWTGSKKDTLEKLISFKMMELCYPMDKEMMLEDEDLVINEDYMEGITSYSKVSWQKLPGNFLPICL